MKPRRETKESLLVRISIALFLLFGIRAIFTQTNSSLGERLDKIAQRQLSVGHAVGVIVGVVHDGQRSTFAYGETVKGNRQKPDGHTLFQIGSITKTFIGALLAASVRDGKVKVDDPVAKYLPEVRVPSYGGREITLLDLATHTSALPRGFGPRWPYDHTTVEQMMQFVGTIKLNREPGERYEYSNLGFALLAEALGHANRDDWAELLNRQIIVPLDLRDTTIAPMPDQARRRAQGYGPTGQPAPWNAHGWPAMSGAGGLYSTMDDMLKYLAFNMGLSETPLSDLLPVLQKPRHAGGGPRAQVGLSWEIRPAAKGTIIWKNGGTPGFHSYIGFNSTTGTGAVVLSNSALKPAPFVTAVFSYYGVVRNMPKENLPAEDNRDSEEDQ